MSKRYQQRSRPPYKKTPSGTKSTANKVNTRPQQHCGVKQQRSNTAITKPHPSSLWQKFLQFGGLSGLGWLGDFCILLSLVSLLGLPPGQANVISSFIAATMVFTVSREKIFSKAEGRGVLRIFTYLGYTAIAIAISSAAVHYLVPELSGLAKHFQLTIAFTTVTAAAKILVTPPTLIINFLMSRLLIEYKLSRREIHV